MTFDPSEVFLLERMSSTLRGLEGGLRQRSDSSSVNYFGLKVCLERLRSLSCFRFLKSFFFVLTGYLHQISLYLERLLAAAHSAYCPVHNVSRQAYCQRGGLATGSRHVTKKKREEKKGTLLHARCAVQRGPNRSSRFLEDLPFLEALNVEKKS
jgi:hypothetical protein